MAKTPARRPPVPKDIKAARGLLDELMILREDATFLKRQNAMLERRANTAEMRLAARKVAPKPKAKAKPAGDRHNGR